MAKRKARAKRKHKIGLAPGSVVFTGNQRLEKTLLHFLQYNEETLLDEDLDTHAEFALMPADSLKVSWYDVRGIHDTALIEQFGTQYAIHPLVLEDISDIYQRPSFEEYENGLFVIAKALSFDPVEKEINVEHVALYYTDGLVISFQETESDLFELVRQRINTYKGRIRARGCDYLTFALLDVLTDNYFVVFEQVEAEIQHLEDRILEDQLTSDKQQIHQLKKEVAKIRKTMIPMRESIGRFSKSESRFIERKTQLYLRDLHDNTIQSMDLADALRDSLNGLQELYNSELNFKNNQVIQILTIVSSIFIPLTFLAGIYGMNFEHMPELHWENGYFYLLGAMAVVFVSLLFYFRKRRWL